MIGIFLSIPRELKREMAIHTAITERTQANFIINAIREKLKREKG